MAERTALRAIEVEEPSLKDRVYESLRRAIIAGEIVAGRLYSVQSLADIFKVSRTPVREALIDLAAQGMVRFERNRGVRVLETSVQDLEEIVTLRLLLEVPATYRATEEMNEATLRVLRQTLAAMERAAARGEVESVVEADRAFHRAILERSGNQRLAQYADHLRDLTLVRGYLTLGEKRRPSDIVDEHRAVLEQIEKRDPAAAAATMKAHILRTAELLLAQQGDQTESVRLRWGDLPGLS